MCIIFLRRWQYYQLLGPKGRRALPDWETSLPSNLRDTVNQLRRPRPAAFRYLSMRPRLRSPGPAGKIQFPKQQIGELLAQPMSTLLAPCFRHICHRLRLVTQKYQQLGQRLTTNLLAVSPWQQFPAFGRELPQNSRNPSTRFTRITGLFPLAVKPQLVALA